MDVISLLSVVCCQVEVSATGRSRFGGVLLSVVRLTEYDRGTSQRKPRPTGTVES
jgi:hypothetical protein